MSLYNDDNEPEPKLMNNTCIFLCVNNACDKLDGFYCPWDDDETAKHNCFAFRSNNVGLNQQHEYI